MQNRIILLETVAKLKYLRKSKTNKISFVQERRAH
jgi:hypothetical protein